MKTNNHYRAIPPNIVELINQRFRAINKFLAPYSVPLTSEDNN
jgi:hypothetical protein